MTSTELAQKAFAMVTQKLGSERSSFEFEMAYQIRVACEKIRFVLKTLDQERPDADFGVSRQLLDALDRLEASERRFQRRSRRSGTSVVKAS